MSSPLTRQADLAIGPSAIEAYSRLSYTMWFALAEFIDNSTQSRENYGAIIDEVLKSEGQILTVDIIHDRINKEIRIEDNSIGMTWADLVEALKIASPTIDSKGRSKYGMGMKTAACWIGARWKIITCEWGSGEEWTAEIDVYAIAREGAKVQLNLRNVSKDAHYTKVVIQDLHRNIQKRTEETIRAYLGSMYRFDISRERLRLNYNDIPIAGPDDYDFDTDPSDKLMRRDLPETLINGKKVTGWVGVLRKGGRKFGGFSLFQNERQIQGFPSAWRPRSIFGGVDDEGANNLVAQRLTGVVQLDGFDVSHTKDAILFQGDEEENLEKFLLEQTRDYRDFAQRRRGARGQPWSREKVKDLLESMKSEFQSGEMKDVLSNTLLPPIETIISNNKQMVATLSDADHVVTLDVLPDLKVFVYVQERSEYEPYVTLFSGAEARTIYVIINGLHPYYAAIESTDALDECIRQYIYDAVAEYRVQKLQSKVNPDSARRLKNDLLRVKILKVENIEEVNRQKAEEDLGSYGPGK